MKAMAPMAAPTPIPAFAHVLSPGAGAGVSVGGGRVPVLEGSSIAYLFVRDAT